MNLEIKSVVQDFSDGLVSPAQFFSSFSSQPHSGRRHKSFPKMSLLKRGTHEKNGETFSVGHSIAKGALLKDSKR